MQAVRKNRYVILPKDFEKAYKKVVKKRDTEFDFYKWSSMFTLISLLKFKFNPFHE